MSFLYEYFLNLDDFGTIRRIVTKSPKAEKYSYRKQYQNDKVVLFHFLKGHLLLSVTYIIILKNLIYAMQFDVDIIRYSA